MTKAERYDLMSAAVAALEEAARLLKRAEEQLLADQAEELADVVDVLTGDRQQAA